MKVFLVGRHSKCIAIPKKIAERLSIGVGDFLEIVVEGDKLVIRKV